MSEELVRQINRIQQQVDGLVRPEVSRLLVAPFLDLPGKVGLWYAGDVQRSTGNVYDHSGQARTLTYTGNPTFNFLSNGIAYIDLDGAGDYLARADETDLDVLGTETIYAAAARGLTMGGWFWADTIATSGLMSKWLADTAVGGSYLMYISATGKPTMYVVNTTTAKFKVHTAAVAANTWNFIVGRFVPSTSVDIYLNGAKDSLVAAVPASLNNSTTEFRVGTYTTNYLDGRASICFLCANALPDATINALFQQTRALFGV